MIASTNFYCLLNLSLQIRQYGRLEDGSLNVVTRGQQRFHLKRGWNDVEGVVRILSCPLLFF
jgi:cereblon